MVMFLRAELDSAVDSNEQLIRIRKELRQMLNTDVSYLQETSRGFREEVVRLSKLELEVVEKLDCLLSDMAIDL